jgi:ABC-type Fe3+/spermidine/putrescine transport system ATPase subunit
VYVTHDQSEALVMSDEIIVMSKGRIEQKGDPRAIYERPANAYVSNFIGAANLLKGRVIAVTAPGRGDVEIAVGSRKLRLACRLGAGLAAGAEAVVSVRPEHVMASRQDGGAACLAGEVIQSIFLGNCVDCRVRWGEFEWKVTAHPRAGLSRGETVYLRLDPERTLALCP